MPVNIGLAQLSYGLLVTSLVIYALAMLAYACDFAFSKERVLTGLAAVPAGTAASPSEVPELVAAGIGAAAGQLGAAPMRLPRPFHPPFPALPAPAGQAARMTRPPWPDRPAWPRACRASRVTRAGPPGSGCARRSG